jgi:cytochrome P450
MTPARTTRRGSCPTPTRIKDRHRFCYLPFGAGQRVCIGMSFALMEGTLIAAMMTQRVIASTSCPATPCNPKRHSPSAPATACA